MLGSLILCLKGMRIMMFQLSGYYCMVLGVKLVRVRAYGIRSEISYLQPKTLHNVGASIITYTILGVIISIVKYPPKPYSKYYDPYITWFPQLEGGSKEPQQPLFGVDELSQRTLQTPSTA